jgi:2Fe-2S ferredoxin
MPIIRFVQPDGDETVATANLGETVMQTAVNYRVPGILGDCGGSCSCATCHAYVDEAWVGRMPTAESYEIDMLTCAMDVRENSRLTCQINVTPELDGLVVRLPSTA